MIAVEGDLTDLDGGSFLDPEGQCHGCRRYGLDLGLDGRKLMTMLAKHLLQDDFGALYLGRVVLALDGEAHLLLL